MGGQEISDSGWTLNLPRGTRTATTAAAVLAAVNRTIALKPAVGGTTTTRYVSRC